MADDKKPTEWRDRVKSPSEKNERLIGGKNSLPSKEGKVDLEKIVANQPENSREGQFFDKETWQKNVDEGKELQAKKNVPDVKEPSSKSTVGKETAKQIVDKIDDLVDEVGQGLKKAAPYLDDAAKVIGEMGKYGGIVGGVVGFFNPESTATDEEMRLDELNAEHNPEQLTLEAPLFSSQEERDEVFETMSSLESEKPDFLKDLEPDLEIDYGGLDLDNPSFDSEEGIDGPDFGFDD